MRTRSTLASLAGLSRTRLRIWIGVFFLALAVPAAVLVLEAYGQLKWEALHQHRTLASELADRIDERLGQWIAAEDRRGFADYRFVVETGAAGSSFVQRSPLSAFPVAPVIPGLIGYFQVDARGRLTTPLLPEDPKQAQPLGVSSPERAQRAELAERMQRILVENRLVDTRAGPPPRPAAEPEPGAAAVSSALASPAGRAASAHVPSTSPSRSASESAPASAPASASSDAVEALAGHAGALRAPAPAPAEERLRKVAPERAANLMAEEKEQHAKAQAAGSAAPQAAFDRLGAEGNRRLRQDAPRQNRLGRVEDLKLEAPFEARDEAAADAAAGKSGAGDSALHRLLGKREVDAVARALAPSPESFAPSLAEEKQSRTQTPGGRSGETISTFASEVDRFGLSLLGSGHLVLFRNVWREGERFVQGMLVEQPAFLSGAIEAAFRGTALSRMSNLAVAWRGEVLAAFGASAAPRYLSSPEELAGTLLYRTRMSDPLSDIELLFTVTRLPPGPGAGVLAFLAAVLAVVLCAGCLLFYRLGVRQIALARQQQDFVSAVSHELRTPITSIRMYGEMLREGWVSEDKRRTYYEYIHDESERLSRLIGNVLQLARMTRSDLEVSLRPMRIAELLDGVRSKVASQVERAGFELHVGCDEGLGEKRVDVDPDCFSQIMINLVDNALKFSADSARRRVEVCARREGGRIGVSVRDYGPGVPRDQMKKIFGLFYRTESGLARETVGTGIGLALVKQLASAMHAEVDVVNEEPGARFTVRFEALPASV